VGGLFFHLLLELWRLMPPLKSIYQCPIASNNHVFRIIFAPIALFCFKHLWNIRPLGQMYCGTKFYYFTNVETLWLCFVDCEKYQIGVYLLISSICVCLIINNSCAPTTCISYINISIQQLDSVLLLLLPRQALRSNINYTHSRKVKPFYW
jgi:hypothetical protein